MDIEIPSRWVLFVYLALELLKFIYERFISQQEYLRILRDIAASQHATAIILKEIAAQFRIDMAQEEPTTKTFARLKSKAQTPKRAEGASPGQKMK